MTIPNRISFDSLRKLNDGDVSLLSPQDFVLLTEELDERKKQLATDGELLRSCLSIRFKSLADFFYKKESRDTGTVDILDKDGFLVQCERAKTVSWDQEKLKVIHGKIRASGEDPAVYMNSETSTVYKVSEAAFKNWPKAVQDAFGAARTVKAGPSNFKIKPKKE